MAWLVVVAALLAPALGAATQSLDGNWQIAADAKNVGLTEHWYEPAVFPAAAARPIAVPGNINEAWPNPTPLEEPGAANLDWYRLAFVPGFAATAGHRYYLRFGAVSFRSEIWLNGVDLGVHDGGQDPFEFDVTHDVLLGQVNTLIVRVQAPYFGGITRQVTLVDQPAVRIIDGFARPDAAAGKIVAETGLAYRPSAEGEHVAGIYRQRATLSSGRFAQRRRRNPPAHRVSRLSDCRRVFSAERPPDLFEVHPWQLVRTARDPG